MLKHIPAGVSKKTNRPYDAFNVCANGCKQDKIIAPQPQKAPANLSKPQEGTLILIDEIDKINAKIDQMFAYLRDRLQ